MDIKCGKGTTEYGPGIEINLTGEDVATAIDAYLVSHWVHVSGARTIRVNSEPCKNGFIYVDPSGFVIANGKKFSGRGDNDLEIINCDATDYTAVVNPKCEHKNGWYITIKYFFDLLKRRVYVCSDCGYDRAT